MTDRHLRLGALGVFLEEADLRLVQVVRELRHVAFADGVLDALLEAAGFPLRDPILPLASVGLFAGRQADDPRFRGGFQVAGTGTMDSPLHVGLPWRDPTVPNS